MAEFRFSTRWQLGHRKGSCCQAPLEWAASTVSTVFCALRLCATLRELETLGLLEPVTCVCVRVCVCSRLRSAYFDVFIACWPPPWQLPVGSGCVFGKRLLTVLWSQKHSALLGALRRRVSQASAAVMSSTRDAVQIGPSVNISRRTSWFPSPPQPVLFH